MSRLLALSPHLDDAVFSAGGALARRVRDGWRVVVATLFTGNVAAPHGFALACQLDKGLSAEVDYMALRREEDRRACAMLGVEPAHVPLLEAPHRGYDTAAALFRPPHPTDPAADGLRDAIRALLAEHAPDEVWAPRALGGHVDHVLVHRTIREAASSERLTWWTDWPYAERPAPADPEAASLAGAEWIETALDDGLRARKADACAAYSSQLGFQFGGEDALRARLAQQRTERFAVART